MTIGKDTVLYGGAGVFFAVILVTGALFFFSYQDGSRFSLEHGNDGKDVLEPAPPADISDDRQEYEPPENTTDAISSAPLNKETEKKEKPASQNISSRVSIRVGDLPLPAASSSPAGSSTEIAKAPAVAIDEEMILRAVVKIQCTLPDGISKSIGSGFALQGGLIVTVAHLVLDSGSKTCDIIFPKDRFPIYYLKGNITEDMSVIRKRFEEEGIDIAFLKLPPIGEYSDAKAIFGSSYPAIPYPVCTTPSILGDTAYHYGYPANYKDLNYLASMEGKFVSYADVAGTAVKTTGDGTATYRAPVFAYTTDESGFHPYAVSKVGIFYGDSGGPVFNGIDGCILGTNHGFGQGTDGVYSIFVNLSWNKVKGLLSAHGIE